MSCSWRCHTWIVDTAPNRAVAEAIWQAHPHPDLERGVTTFQVDPHRSRAEWCGDVLGTVAEHHGEYAHASPPGAIEVVGTALTPALRAALEARTFCECAPTASGCVARSRSAIQERVDHTTWE